MLLNSFSDVFSQFKYVSIRDRINYSFVAAEYSRALTGVSSRRKLRLNDLEK